MHVIRAEFRDIYDIAVAELFGALGTYVLWSSKANRRPSYIGEGKILERFATEHIARFGANAAGVVAVMEGTEAQRKRDAEITESALFEVGAELDLKPTHNKASGKWRGVRDLWEARNNVVKIRCSGCHPLRLGKSISGTDTIELRIEDHGEHLVVHPKYPWRRS